MKKENEKGYFYEIILVIISAILGGLVSLYIYILNEQNPLDLINLELNFIVNLMVFATINIFKIGIALFILYVGVKVFMFFSEIVFIKPLEKVSFYFNEWFYSKILKRKYKESNKENVGYGWGAWYRRHFESVNLVIVLIMLLMYIFKMFKTLIKSKFIFSIGLLIYLIIISFYYLIKFIKKLIKIWSNKQILKK